jgi:hypothetical protein
MKIRELAREWPPQAAGRFGHAAIAEASDEVVSARRRNQPNDHIALDVRKRDGSKYLVGLFPPEFLHGRALIAIVNAKKIRLGEVGELDV